MKNNRYTDAIQSVSATETFKSRAMEAVQNMSRTVSKKSTTVTFVKWSAAAASFLIIAVLTFSLTVTRSIPLEHSTGNAKANYALFPSVGKADLVVLTDAEIFAENTYIFEGEVTSADNIKLAVGDSIDYRAILKVKVSKSYRGDAKAGEVVSVLSYPVDNLLKIEDTGVASSIKKGSTVILMAVKYDDSHFYQSGNGTLYLKDLAEYGLLDGERWAFVKNGNDVVYADFQYHTIPKNPTFDDIRNFVTEMIEKNK